MNRLIVNSLQDIGNSLKAKFKITTSYLLPPNNFSQGLSSLLLLFMVVLGVFILWESNEFISHYSSQDQEQTQSQAQGDQEPICLTGEEDNCNDSNDVFILNE